jgi:Flp pilus assembly protein TadG
MSGEPQLGMTTRQTGRRGRRGECGTSLIEQAFVLVIVLTILFAIIDFGRAMYTYHFVSNAAREATRWASVRGNDCNGIPAPCPASQTDIQNYVKNVSGMALDPSKMTVTANWVAPPNNSPVCAANIKNPGCVVKVQVQYSYTFMFPFLPAAPLNLTSTSQMVISQ